MRKLWITSFLLLAFAMSLTAADTFNLTTGESVVGELLLTSANDVGIQIKVGENDYKRVSWANFSQADLKQMAANPKLQAFVEPFIEVSQQERLKKTDVKPTPPERLSLPPRQSLIGAMFSSALGLFVIFVLYAGNVYAGYEVAIYRAKPVGLVCGVSAVLPFIGPLIFLGMKTHVRKGGSAETPASENVPAPPASAGAPTSPAAAAHPSAPGYTPAPQAASGEDEVNPMRGEGVAHPALHLAHEEPKKKPVTATTTYQRGQFTFNRRFFETRFAGFFGVVKRDAEKDMVLVFKSMRGEFIGERISRISASELYLQVRKGDATEDIMIPFSEVQEIRHKHKDA